MQALKNPTVMLDVLYSYASNSGANSDYLNGMIVGIVSALMAQGSTFEQSIQIVANHWTNGARLMCPASWFVPLGKAITKSGRTYKALI